MRTDDVDSLVNKTCPYLGKPCIMEECLAFRYRQGWNKKLMECGALGKTFWTGKKY